MLLLERSLDEQEKLLKGYQLENERLYAELKDVQAKSRSEQLKLADEMAHLKCTLMNEQRVFKKSEERSPIVLVDKETQAEAATVAAATPSDASTVDSSTMLDELRKRVAYYETNQQLIETDVLIIDEKNKEIKRLGDKLHAAEMGRAAPDFLKQIGAQKKQLREMHLLVKRLTDQTSSRLRRGGHQIVANQLSPTTTPAPAVTLSIDYYEKRIEQLERQLRDKCTDAERLNRMWMQKFQLSRQVYDEHLKLVQQQQQQQQQSEVII